MISQLSNPLTGRLWSGTQLRYPTADGSRGEALTAIKQTKQQVEHCLDLFRSGTLTETDLQGILSTLSEPSFPHQQLLYLQANGTSVTSEVVGMLLVQDGQVSEGPSDPDDWPYPTVLAAMQDGWRVIQFPNLALIMDETRTYGLGCEFVLEKEGHQQ